MAMDKNELLISGDIAVFNISQFRQLLKENKELDTILYITNIINNLEKELTEIKAYNTHLQDKVMDKDKEILRLEAIVKQLV